jgi:NADH-quinone oxidoreductase subunit N
MTFHAPHIDYAGLSPVIALSVGICAVLVGGVFSDARQRVVVSILSLTALGTAAGLCIWQWGTREDLVAGALRLDELGLAGALIAILAAAFVIPMSWREPAAEWPGEEPRHGEFQALLLASVLGMVPLAQAQNLISLFVSLELLSVPLYVLCGSAVRQTRSLESGLKYLIVGSLGSATLLYGLAFIYGGAGSTDFSGIRDAIGSGITDDPLVLIGIALAATGLAFKISIAPFHQWTPDVYQGAPTPVTAFMAAGTKAAAFLALLRVFFVALGGTEWDWRPLIVAIAIITMFLGAVVSISQTDVKRMLAYSSIAHAGFLLVGFVGAYVATGDSSRITSTSSILFYLTVYGVSSIGAFAVVTLVRDSGGETTHLSKWAGLGKKSPVLAGSFALFMLSFAGIPLTGGFIGKWTVFSAAWSGGFWWLVVIGVLVSALAAYFYVRVIVLMFFTDPVGDGPTVAVPSVLTTAVLAVAVIATLGLGIIPGPVLDLAQHAGAFVR